MNLADDLNTPDMIVSLGGFKVPSSILQDDELHDVSKYIFAYLNYYAGSRDNYTVTNLHDISWRLGDVPMPLVDFCLKQLEAKGYLRKEQAYKHPRGQEKRIFKFFLKRTDQEFEPIFKTPRRSLLEICS